MDDPSHTAGRFNTVCDRRPRSIDRSILHVPSPIYDSLRLAAVDTLKKYYTVLEYEYRVKIAALDTLKRYSILSLTLYLE
jgi:hypothetical protein